MKENNTAISNTPITEYIVDGDNIYPKEAPPALDSAPTAAKPADQPKDLDKSKPPRKDRG